jgi:3-oxoacyl-[acyl-carrier-protein] synthase III
MTVAELTTHLLGRLREVRRELGDDSEVPEDAALRFADHFDSMAMVEFLFQVGEDCGVAPERIEECVAHRFGTVGELAAALHAAGLSPRQAMTNAPPIEEHTSAACSTGAPARGTWLNATAVQLPDGVQPASYLNEQLQKPSGWLESHAGIFRRRVWDRQDPLDAAVHAAQQCLERAGIKANGVGALLTTSEAPPLLVGLAAALHHRLGLPADAVALEIGGACTGFLAALWVARQLHLVRPSTLIVAVEAPSRFLSLQPGPAGEAAALFGDGAAACLIGAQPIGNESVAISDVVLSVDGGAGDLIRVSPSTGGAAEVHLRGQPLSVRALKAMEKSTRSLVEKHHLQMTDLAGVFIHGGNGRFPSLLARRLDLPADRIHSETPQTGNLGSASLPVAWAAQTSSPQGPVIWTAVGAGLTWGAALLGSQH